MCLIIWPDWSWPLPPLDPPAPPFAPAPSERPDETPVSHPDPSAPPKRPSKTGPIITSWSPDMQTLAQHKQSASPCVSPVTAFPPKGAILRWLC